MDASPNSITSHAGIAQVRTNTKENITTPPKRRRRRLEAQERLDVAYKRRVGVCSSCRAKKVTCRHVPVFHDQESDLPTPKESNKNYKTALGIKDKNQRIQTNNEGWVVHIPQDFAQTPFRIHKLKRKGFFSGSEVSRKRAKATPEPEVQSGPTENSLQKPTDSIENPPSDIIDLTHADDDVSSDISAEAMTSIGSLQKYPSNQLPVGNTTFYSGVAMDQYPTLTLENDSALASASGSSSYNNVTEDQFDLRFQPGPQTFSADLGRYYPFGYLPPSSEPATGSADTSAQPLAPSYSDVQSAWKILSQAPDQSGMFTSKPSDRSAPNDTIPQTPSRHIGIPSLDCTRSTVESQGQVSATPHDLTNTPTRKTSGEQQGLNILESEEEVCEVDLLKDVNEIGELLDFESLEDFLVRDICKHSVHSDIRRPVSRTNANEEEKWVMEDS